jgi:hypothetical protein
VGLDSTAVPKPVRSRQAAQSPFVFNGLPHIEQILAADANRFPMAGSLHFR